MSEAAETLDGWYSLHLFYAVDWATLDWCQKMSAKQ